MEKRNILIYGGIFDVDSIEMLLSQAKKRMDIHGISLAIKKKLFNIIVECLDNVQKHTEFLIGNSSSRPNMEQSVDHSFFSFEYNDKYFLINTKNVILNNNLDELKEKLLNIVSLDKEGLKRLYEQVIMEGEISAKGGAGLGLIDIALKSNNNLEYDFVPIDKNYSFFLLQVKVDIN